MSSMRKTSQSYSGNYNASVATAIAGLVLGGLFGDDANSGMSALQFQKQLGLKRYETAFLMLHKLRAAMVRPGRDRIGAKWPVEIDETYVGGSTQGEGRGRHHKTLVVGMVEVLPRKNALGPDPNLPSGQRPQHRGGHGRSFIAGRLRLQVIPNRKQETLEPMVLANVQKYSEVRNDGWTGYDNLAKLGYKHKAVPVQGDQAKTTNISNDPYCLRKSGCLAFGNPPRSQFRAFAGLSQRVRFSI